MNNRQPKPAGRVRPNSQPLSTGVKRLSTRDPLVGRIVLAWRRLTSPGPSRRAGSGRPTLVACSGGADSTALVLALAAARAPIVVAHVVHDLRAREDALRDRDAVARLCESLGIEFAEAEVRVPRARGVNLEAGARQERYRALAALARARNIRWIATAHHADDQLETLLMALLRGSGVQGLGAMSPTRTLGDDQGDRGDRGEPGGRLRLIRPMLDPGAAISRSDCEAICRRAGVSWCVDATNAETSRLRAGVRAQVVPALVKLRPKAAVRAAATTAQLRSAERIMRQKARRLVNFGAEHAGVWTCARKVLRRSPELVLTKAIQLAYRRIVGTTGLDALSARVLSRVARAIRDDSTDPRTFSLGHALVRVDAHEVSFRPRSRSATLDS